ncbi:MAG: hypothetical protein ACHQK9_18195 [Reyranellales bacterium]
MTAIRLHAAKPVRAEAMGQAARVVLTLLGLAGLIVLVLALRYGIYDYFHSGGRVLAGMWDAIWR